MRKIDSLEEAEVIRPLPTPEKGPEASERLRKIEEAVNAAKVPAPVAEVLEKPKEDARWFTLRKPITCGSREVDKLFCDVSELNGEQYFQLVTRFRTENHYVYSTSINKLSEDIFLGLVVAELNKITFEDLRKVSFKDLHLVFQRVQRFLYSSE